MLPQIDIVLPAHNEGGAIAETLREFYQVVSKQKGYPIRFVVCEDGSTDNTVEVLQNLSKELPLKLISEKTRKGYSKAVVDGFAATDAEYIGFIDSDGQCDPEDFDRIFKIMGGNDLVMGFRNPRADHWIRLAMSGAFKFVYTKLFPIRLKDPSCPYLIIRRPALKKIMAGHLGILKQGFWWEFVARAQANRLSIIEAPVKHRIRASGKTQVYKPTKVPRIAAEHLAGLFKLREELKSIQH